jgi:glycosyltransferase involved in cell wall biosynthesis
VISTVILTFNEEVNLPRSLEALSWCDDVLIVDSFSTDSTLQIAAKHNVRVVQRPFVDFSDQRNFASEHGNLKHDWIFHLDADEVVTPELAQEILATTATTKKEAFRVSSKLIFNGKFLRHAGLFPWYQVRLGRRAKLRFIQVGHGQRETLKPELIGTLSNSLLHFPFQKGLYDWVEKHNRYSSAEARANVETPVDPGTWRATLRAGTDERRRALKRIFSRLPCRPLLRFFYMFLIRGGILDGPEGLTYCRLLTWYEFLITAKMYEMKARRLN